MWLRRLTIDGIRNLTDVALDLAPGLIGFHGDNGAGKTSVLEAVYCLSSGRSFRSGSRTDFISNERKEATVFGEIVDGDAVHKVGLERSAQAWRARRDGQTIDNLGELARSLAVLTFHPRLHQLIEGAPEERRRFLDFGVFHVEHEYLGVWREYRRSLKQRNAALRQAAAGARMDEAMVRAWDGALASSGERVTALRQRLTETLDEDFRGFLSRLAPELGALQLRLRPGWSAEETLEESLDRGWARDRSQGHTAVGPHRADLRITDEQGSVAGRLSRGQQKMVVMGLTLAMHHRVAAEGPSTPVFCFDDFSSELDREHQRAVLEVLRESGGQVLITGTESPGFEAGESPCDQVFHVEHGSLSEVL